MPADSRTDLTDDFESVFRDSFFSYTPIDLDSVQTGTIVWSRDSWTPAVYDSAIFNIEVTGTIKNKYTEVTDYEHVTYLKLQIVAEPPPC